MKFNSFIPVNKSSEHHSLPGVPGGEYVVFSIATRSENKKTAFETVTVTKVDSQWRVVDYQGRYYVFG